MSVTTDAPFAHAKTIIRHDAPRGGMAYPFLDGLIWTIESSPLDLEDVEKADSTLRWVKDDKVVDLYVEGMDTEMFLTRTGLQLSLESGSYVLSKRMSRVFRPYHFWQFFNPDEITIAFSSELNPALWDGCGLVSSQLVARLCKNIGPDGDRVILERELERTRRFEVTILHEGGQEKGHVLVVDDLAVDFVFPAGATKTQLSLHDRIFVGLHPVHSSDEMRLDVQSLINLHPFFSVEQLQIWLEDESRMFLEGIRHGHLDTLFGRLNRFQSYEQLTRFREWFLGEYLVSGGSLMWFAGTIKAMARQHLQRLGSSERKLRLPIPGGRYYIFPADVGGRDVPLGQVELDPETATAWVSNEDWLTFIVSVLGGCDGDDAVWVVPFTDYDGEKRVLMWRSPNQLGEYVVLTPTPTSHVIEWETLSGFVSYPRLDSRKLPPRIDEMVTTYDELDRFDTVSEQKVYAPPVMEEAIRQARSNRGTLGAYCNALMVVKALKGNLPAHLPARLEDVIDGSVKEARNLLPVMGWIGMVARGIVEQEEPVPDVLMSRIAPSLTPEEQSQLIVSQDHWLDRLMAVIQTHKQSYEEAVECLIEHATPPVELFKQGCRWIPHADPLRQAYAQAIAATNGHLLVDDLDVAMSACQEVLSQWEEKYHPFLLLGVAAGAYTNDRRRDTLLWQSQIAPAFLDALRQIGVLGEPMWTRLGAVLWYEQVEVGTAVPITFNGVWFNWLRTRQKQWRKMSDVPQAVRQNAKEQVEHLTEKFIGMVLQMRCLKSQRVVAYTPHQNLFGYVQRGQELLVTNESHWQVIWCSARDGNITAVLRPSSMIS